MEDIVLMERAARAAGKVLLAHRSDHARLKEDMTILTDADLAAERIILETLAPAGYGVLSEESSPDARVSGKMWVIDPLDGTSNYSRGIPLWCVSIALVDESVPIAGVIYDPLRDVMYAAHGGVAIIDGKPIERRQMPSTLIFQDCAPMKTNREFYDALQRILAEKDIMESQLRSAALALAYTAEGKADAFFGYGQHLWDMAAGVAICRAAGLLVTDWHGREWVPGTEEFLAATPKVHDRILSLLRR